VLPARDAAGTEMVLPLGALLNRFCIVRCDAGQPDPYLARFEWQERDWSCPLYAFLPRTSGAE
jgi:hypothetical protein